MKDNSENGLYLMPDMQCTWWPGGWVLEKIDFGHLERSIEHDEGKDALK